MFRHRSLLWQFAMRNVELRHRGSHLGLIWSFLSPLVMLALYVFVFGYIFGGSFHVLPNESRAQYGLGIFLGLACYNFISDLLVAAPTTIIDNPNFVKKVVFPLEILPAANVLAACVHLGITLGLIFLGLLIFGDGIPLSIFLLPVVLAPIIMMGFGVSWIVASLGVFLRDIRQILPAVSTGLMFASAVFYPVSKIPPAAWEILKYNPLIHAVTIARNVVLWGGDVDLWWLAYLYLVGFGSMLLGLVCFVRLKPAFADVL